MKTCIAALICATILGLMLANTGIFYTVQVGAYTVNFAGFVAGLVIGAVLSEL